MIHRSHKVEIKPTPEQESLLVRQVGAARFAYNWSIVEWHEAYLRGEKPTGYSMRKRLNEVKAVMYPWMAEISTHAVRSGIENASNAYKNFFAKRAKRPKLKKKGSCRDSYRADNGQHDAKHIGSQVFLPKVGWTTATERPRFEGKVVKCAVSRLASKWYVSFTYEVEHIVRLRVDSETVGIDLGLTHYATLSTADKIENPRHLKAKFSELRRISKKFTRQLAAMRELRKISGDDSMLTNGFLKTKGRLAELHRHIAAARKDFIDKLTTKLVHEYKTICIEDLRVSNLVRKHRLSRSIADVGWGEFRRQLEYKSKLYGCDVLVVGTWFASSKLCSACGGKNEAMTLRTRVWTCVCGAIHDRDINAAVNIRVEGLRILNHAEDGYSVKACRAEISPESLIQAAA